MFEWLDSHPHIASMFVGFAWALCFWIWVKIASSIFWGQWVKAQKENRENIQLEGLQRTYYRDLTERMINGAVIEVNETIEKA
ncbi:TPA: hypothetical protein ACIBRT_003758 [Salmonella enterica subsp. enterica serovar Aberdeen]